MLATAKGHFDQDIARAQSLLTHAQTLPSGMLRDDILRSAWMMAVGACDAYFSDAYADMIARALRAKDLEPAIAIPDRLNNLKVPVIAVLRQATGGWRWRMAARELIEDENILSLEKIKKLFNHFFKDRSKLLNADTMESWIVHPDAKQRLFGITAADYKALGTASRTQARKSALEHLESRFEETFQRRHDCIHNCDRPKVAPQRIADRAVEKRIEDITFLVSRCQDAFLREFPIYLVNLGFSAVTRNQVLM